MGRQPERLWLVQPGGMMMNSRRLARLVQRKLERAVAWDSRGRYERASECFRQVLAVSPPPELRAYCLLCLGRMKEKLEEWSAALDWYLQAFRMDPGRDETWYFLHNNAGFCMNRLGRHVEAEALCRIAIDIDPKRANARKNLGIALEGLGRWPAAACAYLDATECCPADTRSLEHLERLLHDRPEIEDQIPGFSRRLAECRERLRSIGN